MSRFLASGRWLCAVALFALLSVTGPCVAEADDCNPGFGMCNHHNSDPEVLTHPLLFVVYWGPEWGNGGSSGFSFNTPSGQVVLASEYVNYLEGFIEAISPSGVGPASAYLDTQTQYGENDPPALFLGDWFDPSEPPLTPSTGQMAGEATQAYAHFANIIGSNPEAIIVIALPPGHGFAGFSGKCPFGKCGSMCAYHDRSNAIFGLNGPPWVYYIALPFLPEAPSCGGFSPNPQSSADSFGHGVLDGVSRGVGHELAETLTDPLGGSWYGYSISGSGQQSASDGETGDKCQDIVSNIGYPSQCVVPPCGGFFWAAQYLWSNIDVQAGGTGCVLGAASNVTAPSSLDFGSQVVHVIGADNTKTVFAGNSGTADFVRGVEPGPSPWQLDDPTKSFFILPSKCPLILHPGDQCAVPVGFIPNQTGPLQATLYLNSGSVFFGTVQHVTSTTLTGNGLEAPRIPIAVRNPIFPPIFVGPNCPEPCLQVQGLEIVNDDTSPHTISNVGLGALLAASATKSAPIKSAAANPDFTIVTDQCSGASLAAGGSCTVDIRFTPQLTGERYDTLHFLDETATERGGILSGVGLGSAAQLTGTGLGPTGLIFPDGELGVTQAQPLTLTSAGQASLKVGSISPSGDFVATSDCPALLNPGSSCTINVALTPTHYNSQNGVLTISDDASDSPQIVPLIGNVDASFATVSADKLRFGCVRKDHVSKPQTVQLAGVEGPPFRITSISTSEDFQQSSNCSSPLLTPCTITVVFEPHRPGRRRGTLTVVSDASNGNQQVVLQGIGLGPHDGEDEKCGDDEAEGQERERHGSEY